MSSPSNLPHHFSSPTYYTNLGLRYHTIYSNDPSLIATVQRFTSYLPPSALVFECGPGTGLVARTIVDAGCTLYGIDSAEGMVKICRERVPTGAWFEVADMLTYEQGEKEGLYDGVVASLSIFEMSKGEIGMMVGKWARWIREGGYLFIATGDPEEWGADREKIDEDGCVEGFEGTFIDHIVSCTLFTKEGWRKLLGREGFEVVETRSDRMQPVGVLPAEARYYIIARKMGGG